MKNITYRQVGDFNIPNLILPPEEANITLSKWGMLHMDYLLKYKKVLFATLLAEGVTEQLKEENQLEWVCRMQNIEIRSNEVVCDNIIYT